MNESILVLGATGNIGSALVQQLADMKASFAGGVPPAQARALQRQGVNAVGLDFGDRASLERAMAGRERLFMLMPLEEPMIGWARNILDSARHARVRYIVRSSLFDARSDSAFALYRIHGQIDQLLRNCGIPYAIVHPNSFMQNFAVYRRDSIVSEDRFVAAEGDAKISFVDVRDIAAVAAKLLMDPDEYRGREYNLTGPRAISNIEAASAISQAVGRTIRYEPVDDTTYEGILRKMGMSQWDIAVELSLERHHRYGKSTGVTGDVESVTGRAPRTFEQFAHDYADRWSKAVTVP